MNFVYVIFNIGKSFKDTTIFLQKNDNGQLVLPCSTSLSEVHKIHMLGHVENNDQETQYWLLFDDNTEHLNMLRVPIGRLLNDITFSSDYEKKFLHDALKLIHVMIVTIPCVVNECVEVKEKISCFLDLKKMVLKQICAPFRKVFSTRHKITKKQIPNQYEKYLEKYWLELLQKDKV
jgi:hypothetical protein